MGAYGRDGRKLLLLFNLAYCVSVTVISYRRGDNSEIGLNLPDQIVANQGATVTLPCRFTMPPGNDTFYFLRWLNDTSGPGVPLYGYDGGILDDPNNKIVDGARYSRSDYDLVIRDFQEIDAGKRCCSLELSTGDYEDCLQLYYTDFKPDSFKCEDEKGVKIENNTLVRVEDSLRMKCSYAGIYPPMDIQLYDNDKQTPVVAKRGDAELVDGRYSLTLEINRKIPDIESANVTIKYDGSYVERNLVIALDINACYNVTCNGKGNCSEVDDGYKCECHGGFSGKECESDTRCVEGSCSGNGVCKPVDRGYVCACYDGYDGLDCDSENKPQESQGQRMGRTIGSALGALTGLFLVTLLVYFLCRHKSEDTTPLLDEPPKF